MAVLVAERDVFDVHEDFVGARSIPDLAAGVARVLQDRADGRRFPHLRVAVELRARS